MRRAQRHAVLRTLGTGERGLDAREIELHDVGVVGGLCAVHPPHPLGFRIRFDQRNLLRGPARELEIADRFLIDRKDGAGRAEFRRHVGDGCAIGERQSLQAVAEELDEFIDDSFFAQYLGHGEHEVGGGRARRQAAGELEADHLGNEHGDRLAEHGGLGLDAADAPSEHAQTVDHGGMRVGSDQRVGECARHTARVLRENHSRQSLEVHLMHDAGVRRHHLEIAERRLTPAQEHVALAVALELDLVVALERIRAAVFIDLHRVVDDELRRGERIHALRIAAELDDGLAHRREIDDARHAGEVLHDDPSRREGDLVMRRRLRIPGEDRLDVAALHVNPVLEAQQILEEDLQRKRQAVDVLGFQSARG